jgi:hypothetical protein
MVEEDAVPRSHRGDKSMIDWLGVEIIAIKTPGKDARDRFEQDLTNCLRVLVGK